MRTRSYLLSVLHGDGTRPYCPFVALIEKSSGYYVRVFSERPDSIDLGSVAETLRSEFRAISPAQTHAAQAVDPAAAVAAFSHPDSGRQEFCMRLDALRDLRRQSFLDEGLMISQMHPYHERGSRNNRNHADPGAQPLYVAGIPLLIVRRMHREDVCFMGKPEEMGAYGWFFGTDRAIRPTGKCEEADLKQKGGMHNGWSACYGEPFTVP